MKAMLRATAFKNKAGWTVQALGEDPTRIFTSGAEDLDDAVRGLAQSIERSTGHDFILLVEVAQ